MMWPMWKLPLAYGRAVVTNSLRAVMWGASCSGRRETSAQGAVRVGKGADFRELARGVQPHSGSTCWRRRCQLVRKLVLWPLGLLL